ncbi:MAG: CHAT domain-containing protein [Gemmatimonadaceae bacterium]
MPLERVPTVQQILDTFRAGDSARRRRLIQECSATSMTDMALMAAGMDMTTMRAQALDFLAMSYANSGPLDCATNFGAACYQFSSEEYDSSDPRDDVYLLCAGRGAISWMTSLQRQGRHTEILAESDTVLAWLGKAGDTQNADSLRLKQIEAQLDLERYDAAEKLLDAIDEAALPRLVQVSFRALRERLKQRKGGGTMLSEEADDPSDALKRVLGVKVEKREKPASPKGIATEQTWKDVQELGDATRSVLDKLFKGGSGELAIRQEILEAASLFADPVAGRDRARIAESEAVLLRARDWMAENNFPENENDACWGLYLCYSRTAREALAAAELQRIRGNIEIARLNIASPTERANLSARFPYLYPALCTMLYKLDRPAEMLEAIESSKGRALADLVALRGGVILPDTALASSVRELPALMQRLDAHYHTFLVDTDCTYTASVFSDGSVRTGKVSLGQEALNKLASTLEDHTRRSVPAVPRKFGDALAPLVSHLEPLVRAGVIHKGEHLCYSPDDAIHVLPLQCATFLGGPLVKTVSVSRAQGAHFLVELMKREPLRPKTFVAVEVPAAQDLESIPKLRAFRAPVKWLADNVKKGETIAGEQADLARVSAAKLSNTLVHFATHGVFPSKDQKGQAANPYQASGMLLAANGKLPDLDAVARGKAIEHSLTPKCAVELELDLSRSHLTLQACVSGLAREGIGGDALGLEWAFLQLGAASILATHWDVRADTTSDFVARFYTRWLTKGETRAVAWRSTIEDFLGSKGELAEAYNWSAFSLSGDWR